jgi:class 3 adenylate cyclase
VHSMKILDQFEHAVRELAEDLAEIPFFSRAIRKRDRETLLRRSAPASRFSIARPIVILIMASIMAFFFQRISYYFDWLSAVANDKHVVDLTTLGHSWEVHYGSSPLCGKVDCYLTESYPESAYEKKMVLPAREFPLLDYKSGQSIYLRTTLTIPQNIRELKQTLAIQSLYIWADHYDFYINDRLVTQGGAETLFVTIPSDLVPSDGKLFLAFKIDPGKLPYQGLSNNSDLLLGPKAILAKTAFQSMEVRTTYYLWFLIPKLIFCLIFSVLFIAVARHLEVLLFVLYGYASAWSIFVDTDYAVGVFGNLTKPYVSDVVHECIAQFLLIGFVYAYFRRKSSILVKVYCGAGLLLGALVVSYLYVSPMQEVLLRFGMMDKIREALRCVALSFGAFEGIITVIYLGKNGTSRFRLISCSVMSTFFICSLILFLEHYVGSKWHGYYGIKALIFEFVLFSALSAVVAVEFGLSVTQKNYLKGAFGRFVDPILVDQIMVQRRVIAPERREISVMFADIRSFTEICEVFPENEVLELVREYRSVMVKTIKEHGGYIDKFVGDAIMAFWGAPNSQKNHAELAIKTASAMRRELALFNQSRRNSCRFEISIGIGLARGEAIVGEIDGIEKTEYTALGQVVNLAARVESFTKEMKTDILFSSELYGEVSSRVLAERYDDIHLKGIETPVRLYKLVGVIGADQVLNCYEARWDSEFGKMSEGGIVKDAGGNLRIFSYRDVKKIAA